MIIKRRLDGYSALEDQRSITRFDGRDALHYFVLWYTFTFNILQRSY
jgi:hypothetical protein